MSSTSNGTTLESAYRVERSEGVATLTLARPAASNALALPFWRAFPRTLADLDRDGTTRALVIAGEGKNFCGGMDVSVFTGEAIGSTETAASREAFYHFAREMQATMTALETVRFPVIAAVQGACVGAGLELLSACDLRYASDDAYFRIEEINIGMMADVGSLQRLPGLLPSAIVNEMAYLGATLQAARAREVGFLNATAATAEDALALARDAARRVASKAPLAIAGTKDSLRYVRDHGVPAALDRSALMQAAIWNHGDIVRAIAARREKRDASFGALDPRAHLED